MAGYKQEVQEGLSVTSTLSKGDVRDLLTKEVSRRSDRNQVLDDSDHTIIVGIAEGKAKAMWNTNVFSQIANRGKFVPGLVAAIEISPRDGVTEVTTKIKEWTTRQLKVSGLIPAGSKSVVGMDQYREFITELAESFREADPQAQVTFTGRA